MLPITTSITASMQDIKYGVTVGHPAHCLQLLVALSTINTGCVSLLQLPLSS